MHIKQGGVDIEYLLKNMHYKTLNVLSLGMEKCSPGYSFSYAYTNFYLIHYVISGCGIFIKNKEPRKVLAGEIFIIKPENVYSYIADKSEPWEYMWFSFDGELANTFDYCEDVIKIKNDTVLYDMLRAKSLKNTCMEYLTGKLYEFISEIFEESHFNVSGSNYVQTVSDYIKSNYMRKISVKNMADAINLNSRYLSRIFKKEKGVTIQEYILKQKFSKAKKLLTMGISVSETALMVGYNDPFTFSKIFKKHMGVAPSEYIKWNKYS